MPLGGDLRSVLIGCLELIGGSGGDFHFQHPAFAERIGRDEGGVGAEFLVETSDWRIGGFPVPPISTG